MNYTKLLEFWTTYFALILPRRQCERQETVTLIGIFLFCVHDKRFDFNQAFISHTNSILHIRIYEFPVQQKTILPNVDIILDSTFKQLAKEYEEAKTIKQNTHLLNASLSTHSALPKCSSV